MSELKGAELERALAGLRDIHLPAGEPAAASVPSSALGWPLLAVLLATAVAVALIVWRHRRGSPRRRILQEIAGLAAAHAQDADTPALLAGLARLLRAQALARHGQQAAGLCGEDWLRWLGEQAPTSDAEAFSAGVGRVLGDGPFRPPGRTPAVDVADLRALVTRWLEHNAC